MARDSLAKMGECSKDALFGYVVATEAEYNGGDLLATLSER